LQQAKPTVLHDDNRCCIALIKNPVSHARTKDIDIQHHFLPELHDRDEVRLAYSETALTVADVLTKALKAENQAFCFRDLGLLPAA